MNALPLVLIIFQELKKPLFLASSFLIAIASILFAIVLLNYKSYISFLTASYPLPSKIYIVFLITVGSFSAMTKLDIFFLGITGALVGINTALVIEKIKVLRKSGGLRLTFGAGIISLAATGCASCGLSLASLVGLAGVLAVLPFGGLELYMLSVVVLLGILAYNLNAYRKACSLRR